MDYDEPLFFRVMSYAVNADWDVIDMVSGSPDWEPPAAIPEGLHEYADLGGASFQYAPATGLVELREAIAEEHGVQMENVVITNGTGEANYLAIAEALDRKAGTEVVLTDPVYPYYPGKVKLLGGTQSFVPVDDDGSLDPAAVRDVASEETACIVVNTPNNPTGAVYDAETMEELVAIAEEYDAVLVSDEVYSAFDYTGTFASALETDSDHRIVTGAFSKTFAITGFRIGYVIGPAQFMDGIGTRHMLINVSISRPGQYAVLHALENTEEAYYEANRRLLADRIETFTAALDEGGMPYDRPDGAFYVMVDIPGFEANFENVIDLIDETGVAGMPGEGFGTARETWIRFALVTPRVEEAADRLLEYFG
ncbi:MAG: pyridoxal phosphate-dependent aminotransferase [Halodesulfurarchaeum sp.]